MLNRSSPGRPPGPLARLVLAAAWLCASAAWMLVGRSPAPAVAAAPPAPLPAVAAAGPDDVLPLSGPARLRPSSLPEPPGLPRPIFPSEGVGPGETTAAASAADAYIPMSELFTADRLERLYGGGLPDVRGAWHEESFSSPALGRSERYLVWLPPGHDASARRYPTLYLLHGVGGDAGVGVEEWLGYALTEDLDRMLAAGLIEPLIVVLPNGEQGYWINHGSQEYRNQN